MSDSDGIFGGIVGFFLGCFVTLLVTMLFVDGCGYIGAEAKRECVRQGNGRWYLDEQNNKQFEFISHKEQPK